MKEDKIIKIVCVYPEKDKFCEMHLSKNKIYDECIRYNFSDDEFLDHYIVNGYWFKRECFITTIRRFFFRKTYR